MSPGTWKFNPARLVSGFPSVPKALIGAGTQLQQANQLSEMRLTFTLFWLNRGRAQITEPQELRSGGSHFCPFCQYFEHCRGQVPKILPGDDQRRCCVDDVGKRTHPDALFDEASLELLNVL